jgi:DNA-binding Lrp family transcriptional regulator
MDEFDVALYHLLLRDPRLTYRELAERMGISLQAVHKRMQNLLDAGVLVGTGAAIPDRYLNATSVFIFGRMSTERPLKEVVAELGRTGEIGFVMLCSNNVIYVSGCLRRVADIEPLHEQVRRICQMDDSVLAIESLGRIGEVRPSDPLHPEIKLSPLDLRIMSSLKDDARKPYAQVGQEAGVTARTVRQRLERMLEEGSIELRLKVNPTETKTITSVLHIYTKEGVDKMALGIELIRDRPANVLFFRSYVNVPDMISLAGNHPTMSHLNRTLEALYEDMRVRKVVPNVVIAAWEFDTWKERLIPKLGDKPRKATPSKVSLSSPSPCPPNPGPMGP